MSLVLKGQMGQLADIIIQKSGLPSSVIPERFGDKFRLLTKLKECSLQNIRFILRAASEEIKEGISFANARGRKTETDVLRVNEFLQGMVGFLKALPVADHSDSEAHTKAIDQLRASLAKGFEEGWLHFLLRAELLCETYFWDQPILDRVGQGLKAAASALRLALEQAGLEVTPVNLLCLPPNQKETITPRGG